MTHLVQGNRAPDFSLKSADGTEFALAKLVERGLVVAAFFKVSCPVCQFTFPFLERMHGRYGGDGVTFLGISQDNAAATKEFAKQFGITFPMALDGKGYPISNAYGLTNVPTIFLIEGDAKIKVSSSGFEKADLEKIATALADRKKMQPVELFRADEAVPAHRPG